MTELEYSSGEASLSMPGSLMNLLVAVSTLFEYDLTNLQDIIKVGLVAWNLSPRRYGGMKVQLAYWIDGGRGLHWLFPVCFTTKTAISSPVKNQHPGS